MLATSVWHVSWMSCIVWWLELNSVGREQLCLDAIYDSTSDSELNLVCTSLCLKYNPLHLLSWLFGLLLNLLDAESIDYLLTGHHHPCYHWQLVFAAAACNAASILFFLTNFVLHLSKNCWDWNRSVWWIRRLDWDSLYVWGRRWFSEALCGD